MPATSRSASTDSLADARAIMPMAPALPLHVEVTEASGRVVSAPVIEISTTRMLLGPTAEDLARLLCVPGRVEVGLVWAHGDTRASVRFDGGDAHAEGRGTCHVVFEPSLTAVPVPTVLDLRRVRVDAALALRVPAHVAVRRQVLPVAIVDDAVLVACAGVPDDRLLASLERMVERPVVAVASEEHSLRETIHRLFRDDLGDGPARDSVSVVHEVLEAAWLRRASDIHVDHGSGHVVVRLRVDGRLEELRRMPAAAHAELLNRIKILGGLDIAEKREAQDGRFTQEFAGGDRVDVRVATLPTRHGERVTLRLLAGERDARSLSELGMSRRDLETFRRSIRLPHGMLLATGPTGCGKTTTLYAALRRIIETSPVNAITIEDPVEYDLPGVAQVQVDTAHKLTFGDAIRSILRHDPDVIMVAEIRDAETANVAIKAALTGHLVLATLHTNSAASAVTRLQDLGVERYLVAATLRLSMSQRLARRLCRYCRRPTALTSAQALALGLPADASMTVYEPRGCVYCAGRGYVGRIGLFEVLPFGAETSRALASGVDEQELQRLMSEAGVPTMIQDAIDKLERGITTTDEVLSAVVS